MRRFGLFGLAAAMAVVSVPAVALMPSSGGQIAEVAVRRPQRRIAASAMASRRYRTRGERHRRVLRANRLTVSRRARRRHRRQRRAT